MPGFPAIKDRFLKCLSHQNLESLGHTHCPSPCPSLEHSIYPTLKCGKVIINIVLPVQVVALNSLRALRMSRSSEAMFVVIAWNERSNLWWLQMKISFPGPAEPKGRATLIPFADGLGAGRMGREAWKTGQLLIVSLASQLGYQKWLSFSPSLTGPK